MSAIQWFVTADCPHDLMDGRTVLMWCDGWGRAKPGYFCRLSGQWRQFTYGALRTPPSYVAPMPKGPEVGRE